MRVLITSIVDLKRVTHNRIHVLAEYLSRRHDVTVLCLNAWWLDRYEAADSGAHYHDDAYFKDLFDRIKILYLTDGRRQPVLQELASLGRLDRLLREVDLPSFDVHLNYGNLIAGFVVGRRARRVGMPTVLDIADDLPDSFSRSPQVPRSLRRLAGLVARAMLGANVRLASRVTVVSGALVEAYGLPLGKAVLIPNGFHAALFGNGSNEGLRKELGLQRAFVVGFVGTLLEWVDLGPAFAALRHLRLEGKDVRMLVVGGGPKLHQSMQLADRYDISRKVVFTNHVPLTTIPDYISCMDVCLVSRKVTKDSDRSVPLKLFEYMGCRKPVISVPLAGVREAVGNRVLYAHDSSELAAKIDALYRDENMRLRMGLEGRQFVAQHYDWEDISRRFEATLAEAAKGSSVAACGPRPAE